MEKFNKPNSVSVENEQSHESGSKLLRRLAKMGTVALVSTGLLLGGNAVSSADEVVGFGGMGDPSGEGYGNMLRATGQLGPNDTYRPVPYPASIAPLGPVTLEQSINEAMVNANPVLDEARRNLGPGEKLVIRGYSEGGVAAARKANEVFGSSVAPGTVIIDGAPVSDTGLFNNQDPLIQTFMPLVTNAFGIPTHDRAPAGTILSHSSQDVWANGGTRDLGGVITQGMDTFLGAAHAVQNPNAPYIEWVGADGIIHREFPGLGTGGVSPNGITMGGPAPEVAPAPAPVPNEQHPRWVPNAPNFEARIHVEPAPVQQPTVNRNVTERVVTQVNKKTGKKAVVRPHVSMNFSTHRS